MPRSRLNKPIAATPAQRQGSFVLDGRTIRSESWHTLVTSQTKVHPDHPIFSFHVFYDPLYDKPLVLATDMTLTPDLIFQLYRDRAQWAPREGRFRLPGLHRASGSDE